MGLRALAPRSARGGACADYDNDGNVDVIVSNIDDKPALLRNTGGNGNHWLGLRLVGTKGNRDAIGAKVTVAAGGLAQHDRVRAGGSYLSSNDLRLHFGLGARTVVDRIDILWPGGKAQGLEKVPADRFLTVRE